MRFRSNPFRGRSGARREIFAYGLGATCTASRSTDAAGRSPSGTWARTPWRRSTTRRDAVVTALRAGDNFGWDVWEGRSRYEGGTARGHVPPAIAHSQGGGYCSITAAT